MKIFKIFWMLCLVVFSLAACSDDDNEVGPDGENNSGNSANLLPPGPDYEPQGKYNNNLNVVYYIPSDSDTVPDWHRRLSGIVLYMQEYYRDQMKAHGLGDKTFHLVLNKQNPSYVKITYIKSEKVSSAQCQDAILGTSLAKADLLGYFKEHPEEKMGSHFLVLLPGESAGFFHGSYANWTDGSPLGLCMVACDQMGFSIENYHKGLADVGGVMHELGHAFFLQHNSQKAWESPKVALMNSGNWEYTPGNEQNVPLTLLDVMWLNQIQPFNNEENNYSHLPEWNRSSLKMELTADKENIYAKVAFESPDEIVGVGFYNDPWHNSDQEGKDADPYQYTEYDAVSYYVGADSQFSDKGNFVRNGDQYEVSVVMPWKDLDAKFKVPYADYKNVKAEIRFRLMFKGGLTIPEAADGPKTMLPRYYYQVHNENPDIVARYLDRSSWSVTASSGDGKYLINAETSDWGAPVDSYAIIDMKEVRKIRALFFQPGDNRTFRTTCVKVEGSQDGEHYTDLLSKYFMTDDNIESYEAILPGGNAEVRYLKLTLLKSKSPVRATFDEISIFPAYE